MYKWIALASGFCLMAFELVAARLLAPTIGSSTFIWTNVIGVIMGAMALGYMWGGKLADKRKSETDIIYLCLATAISITAVLVFHTPVIDFAREFSTDTRWQGLFAAIFLFAPTSVIVGMLSPYLAKLALINNTTKTGEVVAKLSTFNAIGSIAGTFITGFVLFGVIGSRSTLAIAAVIMLVASWLIAPSLKLWHKVIASVMLLLAILLSIAPVEADAISIDTATGNYRITKDQYYGRPVTYLWAGPGGIQSGSYNTGDKDLVFWYTKEIADVVHMFSADTTPERMLILGGGAFSLPEYFGRLYPDAIVDVVEIDPDLETIAREHFRFEKPDNVTIYTEDARSYVNRIDDITYDVIVVDVFSDDSVPWQFLTRQFGDKVASLLSEQGIVIVNTFSAPTPECADISDAGIAVYSRHLPVVYSKFNNPESRKITNREIVFSRNAISVPEGYETTDTANLHVYSDDFAPIDQLRQQCVNSVE